MLVANFAHMPVHLGSMAYAMRGIVREVDGSPGDVVIFNDPLPRQYPQLYGKACLVGAGHARDGWLEHMTLWECLKALLQVSEVLA